MASQMDGDGVETGLSNTSIAMKRTRNGRVDGECLEMVHSEKLFNSNWKSKAWGAVGIIDDCLSQPESFVAASRMGRRSFEYTL